jgi:hypothetical protein
MPAPQISFERDIKPLFRAQDRDAMRKAFDLWSFSDVSSHSAVIAEAVGRGSMPCDGPWPRERVELFGRWIESGKPE